MTSVRLDGMLREFAPGLDLIVEASTFASLLDDLEGRYPRLRGKIRDESGAVRRFVKVFVNGEELARGQQLGARLETTDHVEILHSISGG
jgi:molybdopterin synthase sulfur carrier subunit